jgi:beta-galactosidase/beta-glucuronidase
MNILILISETMRHLRTLAAIVATFALAVACEDYTWQPAGDRIMTEWGENLDPTMVHQEYPRPQMIREDWKNLNGLWNYAITSADAEDSPCEDGKILVPFAVESALSGVGRTVTDQEALWYEREFTVPFSWRGDRILLHFGAVDWHAQVYVDGNFVGEHKGGYSPFSFDITDQLASKCKHTLKLKVLDTTNQSWQPRGKQVNNPHGIWYTAVTGIWQTVWLEPVSESYVKTYLAVSDIDNSTLKVNVDVKLQEGEVCRVALLDKGVEVASAEGADVTLDVPQMKLWSPDSPYLYDLEISVLREGKTLDKVKGYTAMRKISYAADETGHKRLLLNNEPLFQFGPLDQGWWPDGLYTAPSDEALSFDIIKTKEMGYNMIRKHVKVEPARWYWHCDRLGMLVWQDMPSTFDNRFNGWKYSDFDLVDDKDVFPAEGVANYYNEWAEIIATKKAFPCIVVWVPFNEAWGQFNTQEVVTATRELDDTRLINYASGGNFYRECDAEIFDLHHYPNPKMFLYDESKVNVLGEYGGIGWPVEGHLWQPDKNWGYVQYKSADEVLDTYEKYADMLIPLIDEGFAAAVYTQTTDVEIEVNGLMTYDRKVVKLNVERLSAINRKVIESL